MSSILNGLLSFMLEDTPTAGSIESSVATKQELSRQSLAYNVKDPIFLKLFPRYQDIYEKLEAEKAAKASNSSSSSSDSSSFQSEYKSV